MGNTVRLFIAVPIPGDLKKKFVRLSGTLRQYGADVKWVEEENFHITLKFLGSSSEEKIDDIKAAIEKALAGETPVKLSFGGMGAFPNLKRPRIIWIGITEGHDRLAKMAEALETAMEPLGFEPENRPLSPHITLGRVKSPKGMDKLCKEIPKLKDFEGGTTTVEEIHLMKSDLSRQGPTYTVLKNFSLKNP